MFSLSSGTVSSFFPFLSLLFLDDRDFVVNQFLALLFCARHQSQPVTKLRAFPDRAELMTDRLSQ